MNIPDQNITKVGVIFPCGFIFKFMMSESIPYHEDDPAWKMFLQQAVDISKQHCHICIQDANNKSLS